MVYPLAILLILLSSGLAPTLVAQASLAATSWPMIHHDLSHTGRSPYLGSQGNREKWNYLTSSLIQSSPAIGLDGTIYVGNNGGYLYAINPDGTLRWNYLTGSDILSSPAVGSDGTVYVGSDDHNLYAFNPLDGTPKWKYPMGSWTHSSPAIASDGTIYIGNADQNLYAINPNGTLKWTFRTGYGVYSAPAINSTDGTIYIAVPPPDGSLYAINPDRTMKWRYTGIAPGASEPVIGSDGTVYIGTSTVNGVGGGLYAIRPDGALNWNVLTGMIVSTSSIGSDGTIFVGASDGNFYALNPSDGTPKWTYPEGSIEVPTAIGNDGTIYVGAGSLLAISSGGTLKWMYPTPGGSFDIIPSLAIGSDGTIYAGNIDGNLYAINGPLTGWDLTNSQRIFIIQAGGSGSDAISVSLAGGSSTTVSLSCSGLPAGASCSFNPSSGSPDFTSTLTVLTGCSTMRGSYTITVTGTSRTATAITDVFLSVLNDGSCSSVGGTVVPIDKLVLLAPYIGITSSVMALTAAALYIARVKRRKKSDEKA